MPDTLKITVAGTPAVNVPPNSPAISVGSAGGGGTDDHGHLSGLSDDDHAQYITLPPLDAARNTIQPGGLFAGLTVKRWATATTDNSGNPQPLFQITDQTGSTRWLSVALTNSGTVRVESSVPLYMTNRASVQFFESIGNGTNKIVMQAPSSLAADWTLTLPINKGNAGQVLSTDGNGATSWANTAVPTDITTGITGPAVYGRAAGTFGLMAPITATADAQVLGRSAGAIAFGAVPTGTSSSVACAGDDARLSDARTPTAHTHPESDVTGLVADLAGKAAALHTHAWADITIGVPAAVTALSGTNTGDQTSVSGNAGSATVLATARNINGVSFNGSADVTITCAADTLTGTALPVAVVGSSLTSVGTIVTGVWNATAIGLSKGGTGADMSATGGTSFLVKQSGVGSSHTSGLLTVAEAASVLQGISITADVSNSTTNYANITNLKLTLAAGTHVLDGELYTTASATTVKTVIGYTFSGTASLVKFKTAQPHVATNLNTTWNVTGTADNGPTPAASMGATESPNPIGGVIVVTVPGDFQIRFKANTTGTVTVLNGSWLAARKIA